MFWTILIIVGIPVAIIVGVRAAFKRDKENGEEYDGLSDEDKAKITKEEYVRRKSARAVNGSTNMNVLEDKETPKIIKCPACGKEVSNKAKACPHCGQPIDDKIYCPNCGSSNVEVISGTTKAAVTWAVGIYAANTVINKYKCKDCGHKF